jgi:hypothetical protein
MFSKKRVKISEKYVKRLKNIFIAGTLGFLLGLVVLLLFLISQDALVEGYDFIVNIPSLIIMPYRKLPFPSFRFRPLISLLPYMTMLVFFFYFLFILYSLKEVLKKKSLDLKHIVLIIPSLISLSLIPYVLGRSGINHFIPLWFYLVCVAAIYNSITIKSKIIMISLIILFLPFVTLYKNNINILIPMFNRLGDQIKSSIEDCRTSSINVKPKTIFVGRKSYTDYIYNNAILYFIYPNAKPATTYISDEPGLQNSCKYGSIIAKQLSHAKKPMIAYLETTKHPSEPNLSSSLVSCGNIEEYLSNTTYTRLGNCHLDKSSYEIRLYE